MGDVARPHFRAECARVDQTRRLPSWGTYESGRVVVTGGLSVTVSLHDRVTLDDLVLKRTLQFACCFLYRGGWEVVGG